MENEKKEIKTIKTIFYKKRFKKIKAHEIKEDATINLPNGSILNGKKGDFYVCIDGMQDLIIPTQIFNKLFIKK